MMNEYFLNRISILILLLGLAIAGGVFVKIRAMRTKGDPQIFSKLSKVRPAILMFSSKTCPPCEKVQKPIIRRLMENQETFIDFHDIDIEAEPEITKRWGVLTVPTLFLLDEKRKIRFVHHGIATERILSTQIKELL
ncbi:MAG TPA: thioredoxin family protein [Anaerolineales bacterium]|nr:thioredoxin family protein [Anaerolineales bacterium]